MICVALAGQSLPQEMFAVVDATPIPTPRARTSMWRPDLSAWGPITGVGAQAFANLAGAALAAAGLDDEVKLYNGGTGNSALLAENADPANPTNHWQGGAAYTAFMSQVSAACIKPNIVGWWQGWRDYLSTDPNLQGNYCAALGTLYGEFKTAWSKPDLLIDIWPSGTAAYPAPAAAMSPYVQAAQIAFGNGTTGAKLGPSLYDMPLRDGTHGTGAGYRDYAGPRGAFSILHRLGIAGYEGVVIPQFTNIARSGAAVVLDTNVPALYPLNVFDTLAALDLCTGFQAWDTSWSPVSLVGARIIGNQVRLDLAYPTTCHIAFQRGINENVSRVPYTRSGPGGAFMLTPIADPSLFTA